jgi:Insertion element 4 transposase N-terminal
VLAGARIGVLARLLPPGLVDEMLEGYGAVQQRFRVLPARFRVYFVLGLCLFSHLGYDQVIREIVSGLERPLRAAG